MDKSKQPGILFNGIILAEEKFWRDYIVPGDAKLRFDIKIESGVRNDKYILEVYSNLRLIKDDKDVVTLRSKHVGFFSVIQGEENMDIEEYMKNNALALMFPYLREHISSVTAKAGMKPIYLPPTNLLVLLNKGSKENVQTRNN